MSQPDTLIEVWFNDYNGKGSNRIYKRTLMPAVPRVGDFHTEKNCQLEVVAVQWLEQEELSWVAIVHTRDREEIEKEKQEEYERYIRGH